MSCRMANILNVICPALCFVVRDSIWHVPYRVHSSINHKLPVPLSVIAGKRGEASFLTVCHISEKDWNCENVLHYPITVYFLSHSVRRTKFAFVYDGNVAKVLMRSNERVSRLRMHQCIKRLPRALSGAFRWHNARFAAETGAGKSMLRAPNKAYKNWHQINGLNISYIAFNRDPDKLNQPRKKLFGNRNEIIRFALVFGVHSDNLISCNPFYVRTQTGTFSIHPLLLHWRTRPRTKEGCGPFRVESPAERQWEIILLQLGKLATEKRPTSNLKHSTLNFANTCRKIESRLFTAAERRAKCRIWSILWRYARPFCLTS